MTSANVLNLSTASQPQAVNAGTAKGRSKVKGPEDVPAFASLMSGNYAAANANAQSFELHVKGASSQAPAGERAAGQYSYRDNRIEPAQSETIADKIANSGEDPESIAEDVIETVAEDLDVSTEEVSEALEALGMTAFDLLIPQNLVQVATQVTGEDSPADLLLNAQFVNLMQDMGQIGAELLQAFDAAPDQLEELVAQMDILETPEVLSDDEAQVLAEAPDVVPEAQATVQETVLQPVEQQEQTVRQPEETAEQEGALAEEDAALSGQTLEKTEGAQEFSGEEQPDERETDSSHQAKAPTEAGIQQTEAALTVAEDVEVPVADETSYLSIDTMDLIEQIAENVRVSVSEGTSSMEMQLNPENLGKVYLQVSAKEGVVNATIAATNEAVRAALETQVADLRQSLDQAGVKVDAIEVTIASHEFERNLEQNQNGERQQGERQQGQASGRRNISLSSMDELAGVMTEEEALVAQIMRDNGNSVDLTA